MQQTTHDEAVVALTTREAHETLTGPREAAAEPRGASPDRGDIR